MRSEIEKILTFLVESMDMSSLSFYLIQIYVFWIENFHVTGLLRVVDFY